MYDHSLQSLVVRTGVKRSRAEFERENAPVFHKAETSFSLFRTQENAVSNPLVARIWQAVHGVKPEGPSRLEQDVRRRLKKGKSPGRLLRSVRNLTGGVGPRKETSVTTTTKALASPSPLLTMKNVSGGVPLRRIQFAEAQSSNGLYVRANVKERERLRRKMCLVEERQQVYSPVVAAC